MFLALLSACQKKTGLSPEDTALIKGTDRGSFVGSPDEFAQNELSPVGATISGIDGQMVLHHKTLSGKILMHFPLQNDHSSQFFRI